MQTAQRNIELFNLGPKNGKRVRFGVTENPEYVQELKAVAEMASAGDSGKSITAKMTNVVRAIKCSNNNLTVGK